MRKKREGRVAESGPALWKTQQLLLQVKAEEPSRIEAVTASSASRDPFQRLENRVTWRIKPSAALWQEVKWKRCVTFKVARRCLSTKISLLIE